MKKLVSSLLIAVVLPFAASADFAYEFTATVNYKGDETLVDFPVLVRLPGLVTSRMRVDGLDVRFYAEDGETELEHDLYKFVHKDTSLFWVKIPSLSAGSKIVVRFGDPDFSAPAAGTSTWSSYIGVWHMDDYKSTSGSTVPDATGGSTGTGNSTLTSVPGELATAIQINKAQWALGGNPDHKAKISNTGALATDGQLTISWWMKPNSPDAIPRTKDLSVYLFQMQNASKNPLWDVHYQLFNGAAPTFSIGTHEANDGEWTEAVVPDADTKVNNPLWRHFACTFENADGGETATGSIFTDGALLLCKEGLRPLLSAGTGGQFSIGASCSGKDNYCGAMDEVRLRTAVSSAAWLQTERDSVDDPDFVAMPDDLPELFTVVTRRIVATKAEKTGDWEDAVVAGDNAAVAIQSVLDASAFGDIVLFKAGTYALSSELALENGTHNGIRLRSDDGNGNLARETTLLVGGYPTTQNRLIRCAAQSVVIEGFTLTNGYVDASCGGAIWLDNTDRATRILNCDFLGNTAWWAAKESSTSGETPDANRMEGCGGAVFIEGAGVVSNCLFCGNRSFSGGGIHTKSLATVVSPVARVPYVTRCAFVKNSTWGPGANSAKYGVGAGVSAYGAAVIDHSVFASNHVASARGYALACCGDEGLSVSNCTFEGHTCIARDSGYIIKYILLATKSFDCTMIGETAANRPISGDILDGHTYSNCTFGALGGSFNMRNCLFVDNVLPEKCGIVFTSGGMESHVDNCTFIRNSRCFHSSGSTASKDIVNNCVFIDNETIHDATADSNATGAYFFMTNCVCSGRFTNRPNALPTPVLSGCHMDLTLETAKFVDAAGGNFRLQRNSPLRDAGLVLGWMTDEATDRDGKPRRLGMNGKPCPDAIPDIGCYECDIPMPGLMLLIR